MTGPSLDPEMSAPTLTLTRSEMRGVLRRYAPLQVLIVGPDRGVALDTELAERGFRVETCRGPGRNDCPLLRGQDCTLRSDADVAVVHLDPSRGPSDGATLARVRCAVETSTPALIALDGRFDRRADRGGITTMGAARSAAEIADVVEELSEADED